MSRPRSNSTGSLSPSTPLTDDQRAQKLQSITDWFAANCPDNSCNVPEFPPLIEEDRQRGTYAWTSMYANYIHAFLENKSQKIPLLTALAEDVITYSLNSSLMPQAIQDKYLNLFERMNT